MEKLYLGLANYRELGYDPEDPEVFEGYASCGPFQCIQHVYGTLTLYTMSGQQIIPQFAGALIVVGGKLWSDYFFWNEPESEWNMDPINPETFKPLPFSD